MIHTAVQLGLGVTLFLVCCIPAEAQSIGDSMAGFLEGRVNTRIGGGECGHLATEALRVSGGEFVPSDLGPDNPSAGDYDWGSLVTVISYANRKWSDSNPGSAALPGDVIQYRSATLTYSKSLKQSFPFHTSVVKTVNSAGRPTAVYQQNFAGARTVQSATIDVTKLTAGWIRIYRPIGRIDAANQWKVSVVNNTSTTQAYTIMVSTSTISSVSLTAGNTASSFRLHQLTTSGTVPCLVLSNGASFYLTTSKGLEIYNPTSTSVAVRQLTP